MDYRQSNRTEDEKEDAKHFNIQALPVDERVHVDLTREPRNGHEYLLRTRLEAARIFEEEPFATTEEEKTVEGNEHILRTRLEAVAAAERTVKKVGLGKLKRPQQTERDSKQSRGGESKMKQDGLREETRTEPDGRGKERRAKPDGRRDERWTKQDGHMNKKSPEHGVQKDKTKRKDCKGGQPEKGRSGCARSENEHLFLGIHDQLTKYKSELQKKFPKKKLPLEDKKRCCRFCLGSELYSRIYKQHSKKCSGHLPLLSYVIHLEEEEVLLLVQYCYEWYLNVGIHDAIARWLYALLACLDRPVSNEQALGMLESFYLSCFKGRCQDLEYPYQCFVDSLMEKLSIKDD